MDLFGIKLWCGYVWVDVTICDMCTCFVDVFKHECTGCIGCICLRERNGEEFLYFASRCYFARWYCWYLSLASRSCQGYTFIGVYHNLTSPEGATIVDCVVHIWHKEVSLKVSLFVWCLYCNRLPTRDNLIRRRILLPANNLCVGGCGLVETSNNMFLHCNQYGTIWSLLRKWIGVSSIDPLSLPTHFLQFGRISGSSRVLRSYLLLIWFGKLLFPL